MMGRFKQQQKQPETAQEPPKLTGYSFTIYQSLTPVQEPEKRQEPQPDISDSQDQAAAMINYYRQHQAAQLAKEEAMRRQADEIAVQKKKDRAAEIVAEAKRKMAERDRQREQNKGLSIDP